jgi:hypothetical protein
MTLVKSDLGDTGLRLEVTGPTAYEIHRDLSAAFRQGGKNAVIEAIESNGLESSVSLTPKPALG